MKQYSVDTNVIIRLLRGTPPNLALKARNIFEDAQNGKHLIYIEEIIVAQVIWVLTSFYKEDKEEIITDLEKLLSQSWIINPHKQLILTSLQMYRESNFEYIDCWLYVQCINNNRTIVTFDEKLRKFKG